MLERIIRLKLFILNVPPGIPLILFQISFLFCCMLMRHRFIIVGKNTGQTRSLDPLTFIFSFSFIFYKYLLY